MLVLKHSLASVPFILQNYCKYNAKPTQLILVRSAKSNNLTKIKNENNEEKENLNEGEGGVK